MILKADTIPILVRDLSRVIHRRVFVNHRRRRLQYIDKEHAEEYPQQERQQLQPIEEFHNPYSYYIF
jgi:hypothetical protein